MIVKGELNSSERKLLVATHSYYIQKTFHLLKRTRIDKHGQWIVAPNIDSMFATSSFEALQLLRGVLAYYATSGWDCSNIIYQFNATIYVFTVENYDAKNCQHNLWYWISHEL